MRVKCESCAAGYTLPESKLKAGRRVQFACRRCGNRIVVAVPAEAQTPRRVEAVRSRIGVGSSSVVAPARAADSPIARPAQRSTGGARREPRRDPVGRHLTTGGAVRTTPEIKWFVANPDGSYEKMPTSEVKTAIETGHVGAEVLVWRKGWAEWRPAGQAEEWAPSFAALPRQPRAAAVHQAAAPRPVTATRVVEAVAEAPQTEAVAAAQAVAPVASVVVNVPKVTAPAAAGGDATQTDGIAAVDHVAELPVVAASLRDDAEPQRVVSSSVGRTDPAQKAVSLPIVRIKAEERAKGRRPSGILQRREVPGRGSSRAAPASGGRFAAGTAATGTPMDSGAAAGEDADSSWAPATDTYIGPRDRFTRRIGSEEQRQELLARVDLERSLLRQLRLWQWIALGCACAAIVAFGLTVYALIHLRLSEGELDTLRARTRRAAVVAPEAPAVLP